MTEGGVGPLLAFAVVGNGQVDKAKGGQDIHHSEDFADQRHDVPRMRCLCVDAVTAPGGDSPRFLPIRPLKPTKIPTPCRSSRKSRQKAPALAKMPRVLIVPLTRIFSFSRELVRALHAALAQARG